VIKEVEGMTFRRVCLISVVVAAASIAAFAQTAPTKAKANAVASDDEVKVTCKQMVPSAGPAAYALEHFTFNMTKQLLWTDKFGTNDAAPKMPLHTRVSPSQVTWTVAAGNKANGDVIYDTFSFDRLKLVLIAPKDPFSSGYTEQCSLDKPTK
jgi:hypothetical protein